jgi:hypothetical protein
MMRLLQAASSDGEQDERMDTLTERVAGLDVHKASVKATVRLPGARRGTRHTETRTFRTTTAGLVLLADWLASFGVTVVGMKATDVGRHPSPHRAGRRRPRRPPPSARVHQ